MNKLTVGYSVLAESVGNITPPKNQQWELLVITQGGEAEKRFADSRQMSLQSRGVAKSRNAAIENATSEYLVFADDDIIFNEAGLNEAIEYLDSHPEVTLLLGQACNTEGQLRKDYPASVQKLNLLNCARAATYEMVVRVAEVKRLGIRFDENFGAGAENYLGDEYIFIADLLRAGGRADFVPITLATHPDESSGSVWGTTRDRVARAKIFTRVFGVFAPVVRFGFGVKQRSKLGGLSNLLKFTMGK